jgi:hypothetical protein
MSSFKLYAQQVATANDDDVKPAAARPNVVKPAVAKPSRGPAK